MERREFIKNGIILFAAPAIVKIENIMRIVVPRESFFEGNNDLSFDDFTQQIMGEISVSLQIPFELLSKEYKSVHYR